ncbi:MAG: hypothetical protein M2R45_03522 [Verrucomicrobia subdivision 3 bacterium]|nr:hypothetical protein [Limisphaerales bacterium]MCS1415919.1 hypothetical protein [Limisphaerales bacterium]
MPWMSSPTILVLRNDGHRWIFGNACTQCVKPSHEWIEVELEIMCHRSCEISLMDWDFVKISGFRTPFEV